MAYRMMAIDTLLNLLNKNNNNDMLKITVITSLGDIKSAADHPEVIKKLVSLCESHNKDIAIAAIKALSKLLGNTT